MDVRCGRPLLLRGAGGARGWLQGPTVDLSARARDEQALGRSRLLRLPPGRGASIDHGAERRRAKAGVAARVRMDQRSSARRLRLAPRDRGSEGPVYCGCVPLGLRQLAALDRRYDALEPPGTGLECES